MLAKDDFPPERISGFVTCLCDGKWWLACVLEVTHEVRLTFLHPPDPSSLFKYPQAQDMRTVPMENVLTLVDPRTRTGCVYVLRFLGICAFCRKRILRKRTILQIVALSGNSQKVLCLLLSL